MRPLVLVLPLLVGCSGSPTSAPAPAVPPAPARDPEPAGRVKMKEILVAYVDPAKNPNRAALADKYIGKYWEIELPTGANDFTVQEDHIESSWAFKPGVFTTLYFRDKKDLLKFATKDGKQTGPAIVVGKATAENEFKDCFIPAPKK